MSWVLHRVDDRLIHGQVLIAWGQRYAPRRIWVVDDATAASEWECALFRSATPDSEVRVVSIAAAAASYAEEANAEGAAFLLVRDLASALALVEAGAPVSSFNLGGLHYAPGKTKVNEYIYLDEADRGAARALLVRGVTLEAQDVPGARSHALAELEPALAAS